MSQKPTQYRAYEYTGDSLVYSIIEVDEILAKKDNEIARQNVEIEEAVKTMKSLNSEIIELKKKLEQEQSLRSHWNEDDYAMVNEIERLFNENEKLKQKLESVQASMYADVVDANMDNRRLRRALWLARAERASDKARIFYFANLETMLDIDGFSHDSKKKKGHKKMTARIWRIIWLKVERKNRAKAEEYR